MSAYIMETWHTKNSTEKSVAYIPPETKKT